MGSPGGAPSIENEEGTGPRGEGEGRLEFSLLQIATSQLVRVGDIETSPGEQGVGGGKG